MGLSHAEQFVTKGVELYNRISAASIAVVPFGNPQTKVILSFDLYCLLLEYAALLGKLSNLEGQSVEEFMLYDELIFDAGDYKLSVAVDFFAPSDTILIQ